MAKNCHSKSLKQSPSNHRHSVIVPRLNMSLLTSGEGHDCQRLVFNIPAESLSLKTGTRASAILGKRAWTRRSIVRTIPQAAVGVTSWRASASGERYE